MSEETKKRPLPHRLLQNSPGRLTDADVMATLAWVDAVERLDILIMEIRHIQSNIVQLLRKPRLLNLLRYEEIFIWGTVGIHRKKVSETADTDGRPRLDGKIFPDWIDLFRVLDDGVDCLPKLSAFFVPAIDSRSRRDSGEIFAETPWLKDHGEARKKLIQSVSHDVEKSLFSSIWGQEHRRSYHLFRALQRMKRNLVLAKLQLCWWGAWAFRMIGGSGAPSIDKRRLSHFVAVRAGVMVKLSDAVERLSDLQGHFERALDLGPQQTSRPLGGRRRHGALSAAFLHNRSHQLWSEIHQLLTDLGVKETSPQSIRPLTTHRWHHDSRSSFHVVFDDTIERRHVDDNPVSAIDFLISSYWAPDRPDLQTMIAHEAAAGALGQRLPLADSMQLGPGNGDFAELLRMLNHAIVNHPVDGHADEARKRWRSQAAEMTRAKSAASEDSGNQTGSQAKGGGPQNSKGSGPQDDLDDDEDEEALRLAFEDRQEDVIDRRFDLSASFLRSRRGLLPLLAADLLATSMYGSAYLFALFQVTFGRGMEQLFTLPSGQVDLSIAREAWILSHLNDEVQLEWYVRTKVVCAWLKTIERNKERSQLGLTLVRGIESLCDQTLKRILQLYHGEHRQWPLLWQGLTDDLCDIVAMSPAAIKVRIWRRERLKPYKRSKAGDAEQAIRRTSRSSRPMTPDLAGFLRSVLITQKCSTPGRGLHRELEKLRAEGASFEGVVGLFDHLYLQDQELRSRRESSSGGARAGVMGAVQSIVGMTRKLRNPRRAHPPDQGLDDLAFFRSLHDIPWEAAIMRAYDFLDYLELPKTEAAPVRYNYGPIAAMSLDFQPGRETFQVALEFQLLLTKRPADRLHNCFGLVKRIREVFDAGIKDEGLEQWYRGSVGRDAASSANHGRSIEAQLEIWAGKTTEDDDFAASAQLISGINNKAIEHKSGTCNDGELRDWCKDIARTTPVERLLHLGGSIQGGDSAGERRPPLDSDDDIQSRVRRSANYVLNRIQDEKLEDLATILSNDALANVGIETRQGEGPQSVPVSDDVDWKAIDFLITLNKYLELNSSAELGDDERDGFDDPSVSEKRVRSRAMILHAFNCWPRPGSTDHEVVDDGQAIDIHEIGYLSVSEAMEFSEPEAPKAKNSADNEPASERDNGRRRLLQLIYEPPHVRVIPFAETHLNENSKGAWPEAIYGACLGRFDRIMLCDSHPLLTHRLPRFARRDDPKIDLPMTSDGTTPPLTTLAYEWDVPDLGGEEEDSQDECEAFVAFVQQREIALRLSLSKGELVDPDLVPLALLSVGLTQRYSRLEFIGRILQAIYHQPKIGAYAVDGIYHLLKPGDQAYLTDGAYDVTIVIMGSRNAESQHYHDRLLDALRIGITLHGDFMVDRTETHLLLPMINSVLAKGNQPLSIVQEIRLKESSTQQFGYRLLFEEFQGIVAKENDRIRKAWDNEEISQPVKDEIKLKDIEELDAIRPKMYIIPGRADVAIWYNRDWLRIYWDTYSESQKLQAGLLDGLMSMALKNSYVDRVITTVGADPDGLLNWKS